MKNRSVPRIPSTRWLFPSLIVTIASLAGAPGCVGDEPSKAVSLDGTVVFVSLEGGFYGIAGDDGTHWDPENLPDEFAIDGLPVSCRALVTDEPSFHMWGRTVSVLSIERTGSPPPVDLEPFKDLARTSDCADVRNRLFLIDGHLVFWDRESLCADAAYAQALYGRSVDHLICHSLDSIAGPVKWCHAAGRFSAMFETMITHLDAPDLGLDPEHTVEPVDF